MLPSKRDSYWLYVVTRCRHREGPKLMQIADPAQFAVGRIRKIDHYALKVAALGGAK
jgi:hypothetical protein